LEELCERVGCTVERELPVQLRDYEAIRDVSRRVVTTDGKCDLYITTHEDAYMLDVTVVHPLTDWAMRVCKDSGNSSKALAARERTKRRKYGVAAKEKSATMVPFVVDVYGRLGTSALDFLRQLGDYAESRDRYESRSDFLDMAYRLVSAAIQRGNDATISSALRSARNAAAHGGQTRSADADAVPAAVAATRRSDGLRRSLARWMRVGRERVAKRAATLARDR
jgi:hypothetical protein